VIGKNLAHYRILKSLGKGGMGEVYLAEDTKLNRRVALKILPPEMAGDPERRRRFEREAQAVAALNHPNIVTIHSVEEVDGIHFLTMERLEGETLAAQVPKEGLPLGRFFEIAVPLLDAVSASHERGITHRDLKPDNIIVTDDGRLKVLDFGLAKLREEVRDAVGGSHLPTATATEPGKIVGTVAYMSPEQAQGKAVDDRSDIFSLGVVLYEMATGQRPFTGDNSTSILTSVLRDTPPLVTDVRSGLPRHLGRIVRRCLQKDPERRYHHAKDLRNDLEELKAELDSGQLEQPAIPPIPHARRSRFGILLAVGVAAIVLAAVSYSLFIGLDRQSGNSNVAWEIKPLTRSEGHHNSPSWSPDGSLVAFSRVDSGYPRVYVMATGGGEPVLLTDSPGDHSLPRWSPDGQQIAFVTERGDGTKIYLAPPLGGEERELVTTDLVFDLAKEHALGATPWSPDSRRLLFARSDGIWEVDVFSRKESRVAGTGGAGVRDSAASWSFDGKTIVFQRQGGDQPGLWLLGADGGDARRLLDHGTNAAWNPDGRRIVFSAERAGHADLWEIEVASGNRRQLTFGAGNDDHPVVARDGRLAFEQWTEEADLWVTRIDDASATQITADWRGSYQPHFSPDGTKIAYSSSRSGHYLLWLLDLDSGANRQLTFEETADSAPDWSPDGKSLVFYSDRTGKGGLWILNVEGGAPRRLIEGTMEWQQAKWSPDGRAIAYFVRRGSGGVIRAVDPDGSNARDLVPEWRQTGVEHEFDWYRDSRHIVYTRRPQDGASGLELVVRSLDTGEEAVLYRGPHTETIVTPDGSALAFCADWHFRQDLYVLQLKASDSDDGLPEAVGEPLRVTDARGQWHVHVGGWSPDGEEIVYSRCAPQGDLLVIENYR